MSGTSGGPNSFGSSYGVMSNPNAGSGDPYSSQGTYNKYGNSSQFGGGNPWMRQPMYGQTQPMYANSAPSYGSQNSALTGGGNDVRIPPPDAQPTTFNPQYQTGGQDYASGDPRQPPGMPTNGNLPGDPYQQPGMPTQGPTNGAGGGSYSAGGVGNPGGGASSQGGYDPRNPTGQPTFRDQYGIQRFSPLPSYGGIPGSQWWGQTQAPSSIFGYGQGSNGYDGWSNRFGGGLQGFLQQLRGYGR